jgi:hypothetical protein
MMMPAGENSCPPELSGSPTSRDIWEQVGGMDERVRILHILHLIYVNESLTYLKILRHGASGFNSHPEKGSLGIFTTL